MDDGAGSKGAGINVRCWGAILNRLSAGSHDTHHERRRASDGSAKDWGRKESVVFPPMLTAQGRYDGGDPATGGAEAGDGTAEPGDEGGGVDLEAW